MSKTKMLKLEKNKCQDFLYTLCGIGIGMIAGTLISMKDENPHLEVLHNLGLVLAGTVLGFLIAFSV